MKPLNEMCVHKITNASDKLSSQAFKFYIVNAVWFFFVGTDVTKKNKRESVVDRGRIGRVLPG